MSPHPVVVQCGAGKLPGIHPVIDLYTGPLWSTLRRVRDQLGRLPVDVYVMSAAYGLVPVQRRVPSYNALLSADPTERHHVHPDALVPQLREQLCTLPLQMVSFCGSQLYCDTLERAGANVVQRIGGVPFRHGVARAALRAYLQAAAERA